MIVVMIVVMVIVVLVLMMKRWMLCRWIVGAIADAARRVIVIIGMPREVQTRTHYGREQIAQSGQPGARERPNIVNVQGCA